MAKRPAKKPAKPSKPTANAARRKPAAPPRSAAPARRPQKPAPPARPARSTSSPAVTKVRPVAKAPAPASAKASAPTRASAPTKAPAPVASNRTSLTKTAKVSKGAIAPAIAPAAATNAAPTKLTKSDRKSAGKQKVVQASAAPAAPAKPVIKAGPGRIIATPAARPPGSKPIVVTPAATAKKKSRVKLAARAASAAPPPPLPPSPVTTDGKPRKNLAGLNLKDLEYFRSLLLAKRRELVGDMSSMEREALRSTTGTNLSNLPLHMADMGTDNYEQEFTLGLVEKDRQLLREINRALAKIQDGSYGICEGTGKPISKPRLEAQPWAKYSIEHARALERNMLRR